MQWYDIPSIGCLLSEMVGGILKVFIVRQREPGLCALKMYAIGMYRQYTHVWNKYLMYRYRNKGGDRTFYHTLCYIDLQRGKRHS